MPDRPCRCGHPKSVHTMSKGPNSNGRYFFGLCHHGHELIRPYYIEGRDACRCRGFRLRWWRPWGAAETEGERSR